MTTSTDLLRWFGLLVFVPLAGCISPTAGEDTDGGSSGSSTTSMTTTAAPTTAGASSSSGSRGSSESTTAGGLPPGSGCCEAHAGPGCDESTVQACVCDVNAACCGFDWSQECVDVAQRSCEATCEPDATTGDSTTSETSGDSGSTPGEATVGATVGGSSGGGELGPCCEAIGSGGGCLHQPTEQCVCAIDSTCCDNAWTAECAALAQSDCNACTSGDCCTPQGSPGCNDETVQTCVCALDDFCCNETYDEICADLAASDCNACNG